MGGFIPLQRKLIKGDSTVDCKACSAMMDECEFSAEKLKDCIDTALRFESEVLAQKLKEQEALKEKREKKREATKDQQEESAEEEDVKKDEEEKGDPYELVKKHADVIELLKPGEGGKTLGYRCLICKSKGQPEGKVGELHHASKGCINHFLGQHLESTTHLRNLARMKREATVQRVLCKSLRVDDELSAGILYDFRAEFDIWISMVNFQHSIKHQYTKDPAEGWLIRSGNCGKVCFPPTRDDIRPMCEAPGRWCLACFQLFSIFKQP